MPASASLTPAPLLFSPSAQREGSIPSSPTSVHSSTSAIFERDIQLPIQHSPHKDPHRTARAVNHEPIESAVPSVLTAAIEALGDDNGRPQALEDISVLAPSHPRTLVSRSPSPQLRHRPADSIQTPLAVNSNSPRQPPSPSIVPPTPNANSFGFSPLTSGSPSSAPSSPPTSNSPLTPPAQPNSPSHARIRQGGSASASPSRPTSLVALSLEELSLSPLVCTTADLPVPVPPDSTPIATSGLTASSHASSTNAPPSPSLKASKRLSFVSYNDLLNSTPVSAFTLAAATHPSIEDEPPHLVGGGHSKAPSVRGSPTNDNFVTATTQSTPAIHAHDLGAKGGGEWQREGLGTSLEERLEAVLKEPAVSGSK